MRDQMEKRPYTTPNVVRVKLTHEQAVLSQCSVSATTISDLLNTRCHPSTDTNCRRSGRGGGTDSMNAS